MKPGFLTISAGIVAACLSPLASVHANQRGPLCEASLTAAQIELRATGIESSGNWAVLAIPNQQEYLLKQGASFLGCYDLVQVKSRSIILRSPKTRELREFFFGGFSGAAQEPILSANRDPFVDAIRGAKIEKVTPSIEKITYPPYSDDFSLPKVVYHHRKGEELFKNREELGLGDPAATSFTPSSDEGVLIGKNSERSFFGALGLKEGYRIHSLGSTVMRSERDILEYLKKIGDRPVYVGYIDRTSSGIRTITASVVSK